MEPQRKSSRHELSSCPGCRWITHPWAFFRVEGSPLAMECEIGNTDGHPRPTILHVTPAIRRLSRWDCAWGGITDGAAYTGLAPIHARLYFPLLRRAGKRIGHRGSADPSQGEKRLIDGTARKRHGNGFHPMTESIFVLGVLFGMRPVSDFRRQNPIPDRSPARSGADVHVSHTGQPLPVFSA